MNYHHRFDAEPIKILFAEPESSRRQDIVQIMDRLGATTEGVDREDALFRNLGGAAGPDALVLSREMAGGAWLDLLRRIRSRSDVPVILTGPSGTQEIDRVLALELGADDHLEGAIGAHELVARIRAILRRASAGSQGGKKRLRCYQFGDWRFDQPRRKLIGADGQETPLSKTEFELLTAFVAAPRRVLSREHLLIATRSDADNFDRSVDVQVLRLRRKLGDDTLNPRYIRTERGAGYVFDMEVRAL